MKGKGKRMESVDQEEEMQGEKPLEVEMTPIIFESETFFSLAKRKVSSFFSNITLEPVMLFYGIIG